jgi:hypothetical protein
MIDFSDMDDFDGAVASSKPTREEPKRFPCISCAGTGRYSRGSYTGQCFACDGRGYRAATAAEQQTRRDASRKAKVSREENRRARLGDFIDEHKAEYEWMLKRQERFDFAAKMLASLNEWGSLTENQLAAVRKCVARDAEKAVEWAAERAQKAEQAQAVDLSKIVALFATARESGLKRPVLRFGEIQLSLAGPGSRNAGSVYVKRGDTYLGKISPQAVYSPSYASTADDLKLIEATAASPLDQAVAYGRKTGSCACCGRELTDPESIAAGIGPICQAKWSL